MATSDMRIVQEMIFADAYSTSYCIKIIYPKLIMSWYVDINVMLSWKCLSSWKHEPLSQQGSNVVAFFLQKVHEKRFKLGNLGIYSVPFESASAVLRILFHF